MEPFARIVVGYHGCEERFARKLLLGTMRIEDWQPSTNEWDWLGHGIYFWEHSPERALRWANEKHLPKGNAPGVLGAIIQLGRSFDLLNEAITSILSSSYHELAQAFAAAGQPLPQNLGKDLKR